MTDNTQNEFENNDIEYMPVVTSSMKWWLSLFLGFIFFILALPWVYNATNGVWTTLGLPSYLRSPGCPNIWGVLIHAILFALIIRLILW
ncbi:MAG: hypothetical protein QW478_01355 [Candidatus Micrarchaeaceae archaeon]